MGGNLASIHNKKEHTFIQDLIRSKTGAMVKAWIGGYDVTGKVRNINPYELCLIICYRGLYTVEEKVSIWQCGNTLVSSKSLSFKMYLNVLLRYWHKM